MDDSEYIGRKFGRLTVIGTETPENGFRRLRARCDCGAEVVKRLHHIRDGLQQSCGCLRKETARKTFTTHGGSNGKHPAYRVWKNMIQRCTNPNLPDFKNWGGRGITVCERWKNDFAAFAADMGPRPSKTHSVERIDNNGDYEPGNCTWADRTTQNRNRRDNHLLTLGDQTMPLSAWAERLDLSWMALYIRIYRRGWPLARALTRPKGRRNATESQNYRIYNTLTTSSRPNE